MGSKPRCYIFTHICPHNIEHVWKKVLKKDGIEVRVGWPSVEMSNANIHQDNKYLEGTIFSLRNFLQKKTIAPKKPKKGSTNIATIIAESTTTIGNSGKLGFDASLFRNLIVKIRMLDNYVRKL